MHSALILAALVACVGAINDCKQYTTCATCLNITSTSETRVNCGWCHDNIVYADGHQGARCADIRDSPWKCPGTFDTYQCSVGYKCNFGTGQCEISTAGEGDDKATCEQHCFKTPDLYLCNVTTFTCDKCADHSDPNCKPQTEACTNCVPPPAAKFQCIKNSTGMKCNQCEEGASGCTDFHSACAHCFVPPPTPPPSPGPHPPPPPPPPPSPSPHPPPPPPTPKQNFMCNKTTLTCEQSPNGTIQQVCSSLCSNHTPTMIIGTWRGIAVQSGFTFGEYDLKFDQDTVEFKDPTGAIAHGKVSVLTNLRITWTDGADTGKVTTIAKFAVANGPETTSDAFAFSTPGGMAPISLAEAMTGSAGPVLVLSQCNTWKAKQCNFASVFPSGQYVRNRYAAQPGLAKALPAFFHKPDPCNAFDDCSSCINARDNGTRCGWCMGGNIVYNDTGDSGKKCGGYVAGQPFEFTCTPDFRTEDCKGFNCQWNATVPTCAASPNGQYSTEAECEQTCKKTTMAKCNTTTKQCAPCTEGSPGCLTKSECDASCNQPKSKCNYITRQCESCDPGKDTNCTMSAGECDTKCQQHTYGICNLNTGSCDACDPGSGKHGCVTGCNTTCTKGKGYGCNQTSQECVPNVGNMTLEECGLACLKYSCNTTSSQCMIGTGSESLQQCADNCTQPGGTFGCDWTDKMHPVCKEGKGHLTPQACAKNCHLPFYAKCNYATGECEQCQPGVGDPACIYTSDYCHMSCKNSTTGGVWRGIEISHGFDWGEWDFTFFADNKVAFELRKTAGIKYEASVVKSGESQGGAKIVFTITEAPAGGPITVKVGDVLTGIYTSTDGESQITKILNLALSLPAGAVTTFDDGMSALEFTLVSCASSKTCDFSKADLPE